MTTAAPLTAHRPPVERILLRTEEIATRVAELGSAISRDYAARDPILMGVLKGVVPFMSDLARKLTIPCTMDYLAIEPFGNGSGSVQILKDLEENVADRHVLIIEDIIDTGLTLNYLIRWLRQRQPASLDICVLLDRPRRRLIDLPIAYRGFEIPEDFVVGYGLDFEGRYRHLPYIGLLQPEAYRPHK